MEWTKEKQINEEDLFVGKRLWVFNLALTPRYRKRMDFISPSNVYIDKLSWNILLKSPYTSVVRDRDWFVLSKWTIGYTAGFFETEEDAVGCWNEALDNCLASLDKEIKEIRHSYFDGDDYYNLTRNKKSGATQWTSSTDEEMFKEGAVKYIVNFSSPFCYQVGLDVPVGIRETSRSLGGGCYPIYLGRNRLVYEDSPKDLWSIVFPSRTDAAVYYSYIGRYDVCSKIDQWAEVAMDNIKSYKL